jgi:hypothetical protein
VKYKLFLRRLLWKFPAASQMVHSARRLNKSTAQKKAAEADWQWIQQMRPIFGPPLGDGHRGRILCFAETSREFIRQQSVVLKSFEKAGYTPVVIGGRHVRGMYRAIGVTEFVEFERHIPFSRFRTALSVLQSIHSQNELLEYVWRDIRCGKYAISSAMRALRKGSFSLLENAVPDTLVVSLERSLGCATAAMRVLDDVRPSAMLFVDRGYSPQGEFFDACINRQIPCFTWNAGHKDNVLILKRYSSSNRDVHPSSLSDESWALLNSLRWTAAHDADTERELAACYSSGQWYGEVGTQFNREQMDANAICQHLNLDQSKRTAVIFSHIFWDATFFWGKDLFRDYEEWFVQTVLAACKNPNVNWIVKIHPANVVKNTRDGVTGEPSEVVAIRDKIGVLPRHIKVVDAASHISTWSLLNFMDMCLTVRGTVGIEAALLGKMVLTAGTGRYDGMGFTRDFADSQTYLDAVKNIHTLSPPPCDAVELARRYAYGVFLCRPVQLRTVSMRYLHDAYATLDVRLCVKSADELRTKEDLSAMSEYIRSAKEDFFHLPRRNVAQDCVATA